MTREFDRDFWEARYGGHPGEGTASHGKGAGHETVPGEGATHRHGAGRPQGPRRPNPQLLAETAELTPGLALDAGCGEGADARWLAARGWRVTAVDIAGAALRGAREQSAALGPEAARLIDWQQADLTAWTPPADHFDLVSSQYVHTTGSPAELLRTLAAAVAPGGTLLFVGHHPADAHSGAAHGPESGAHVTAEEAAAALDPGRWEVLVAESRPRTVTAHDGRTIPMRDTVLRARRRI